MPHSFLAHHSWIFWGIASTLGFVVLRLFLRIIRWEVRWDARLLEIGFLLFFFGAISGFLLLDSTGMLRHHAIAYGWHLLHSTLSHDL